MKKYLIYILLLLLAFTASCSKNDTKVHVPEAEEQTKKTEVTMYLWDKSMSKELTPWLEEQFPQYDISFIVGYNNMDYYIDLYERTGDVPDIITCRRFSVNDASSLSDYLLDFSSSDIAGTFYPGYIEYNRENDGAVRWLPMCAIVDGYVANIALFEEYGIPIPTDSASFTYAVEEFEKRGIRGFATDFVFDYTCLELLQASSIPLLSSLEGMIWRSEYESGVKGDFDEKTKELWREIFLDFEEYLSVIKPHPEDNYRNFSDVVGEFKKGKTAMIRATSHDSTNMNLIDSMDTAMLPYYGESENDSWILTYPMFQVAVSKSVTNDSEKYKAVMEILEALFSQEGQGKAAAGTNVLSYNKTVDASINTEMRYVSQVIDRNHLYIRLASTEFFDISKTVVQKMVNGDIDGEEAYEEFISLLLEDKEESEEEVVLVQPQSYSVSFLGSGIEAASALVNTIRIGAGTEIAISYGPVVSSPVIKGEYTEKEIKWIPTGWSFGYTGVYTGEEIIGIMEWLINTKEDGSNPVRHKHSLPVASGMEYSIRDNGDNTYTLLDVTAEGKPIEKDREYSLLLFGNDQYISAPEYCGCPMPQWLREKINSDNGAKATSVEYLMEGIKREGCITAPTDYINIIM